MEGSEVQEMNEAVQELITKMKKVFIVKGRKYLVRERPKELDNLILPDNVKNPMDENNWEGLVIQTGTGELINGTHHNPEELEGKVVIIRGPQPTVLLGKKKYHIVHESGIVGYFT